MRPSPAASAWEPATSTSTAGPTSSPGRGRAAGPTSRSSAAWTWRSCKAFSPTVRASPAASTLRPATSTATAGPTSSPGPGPGAGRTSGPSTSPGRARSRSPASSPTRAPAGCGWARPTPSGTAGPTSSPGQAPGWPRSSAPLTPSRGRNWMPSSPSTRRSPGASSSAAGAGKRSGPQSKGRLFFETVVRSERRNVILKCTGNEASGAAWRNRGRPAFFGREESPERGRGGTGAGREESPERGRGGTGGGGKGRRGGQRSPTRPPLPFFAGEAAGLTHRRGQNPTTGADAPSPRPPGNPRCRDPLPAGKGSRKKNPPRPGAGAAPPAPPRRERNSRGG